MCGFAAIIETADARVDERALRAMTDAVRHRGPDDEGYFVRDGVGFGFRRLAILDLTPSAHQPMRSLDGRYTLVFNGEIFNYIELREELSGLGSRFQSTGDTEVLLRAFEAWGPACVQKFNGMWAFLIHDSRTGTVTGARDRFGVKPLYYYQDRHRVLFGSEIKAIRASGYYRDTTNWRTAARYFLFRELDGSDETFFADIKQVPAGHLFELDRRGTLTFHRFWRLSDRREQPVTDAPARFRDLFEDAVRLRLRSDVPVGVTLSGGLDSTAVICAAARLKGQASNHRPVPTLAFSFNVRDFDESRFLADTIAQTHADIRSVSTDPVELWGYLDRVLRFHDEPVHSLTAVAGFRIMELAARSGVKVVLGGQGADETLAGYAVYFPNTWYSLLASSQYRELWSELNAHTRVHGGSPYRQAAVEVKRYLKRMAAEYRLYRWLATRKKTRSLLGHPWFGADLGRHLLPLDDSPIDLTLRGTLLRSVECVPLPLYLRVEDRNSMAQSIEARLPFMDYRLVSFAFELPPNWKMRGPWNKFILREAMKGRIPESVRTRPDKMGFPVPSARWFRQELSDMVQDTVRSKHVAERGIYDVRRVIADANRHRRGEIDASIDLFQVLQFERWLSVCAEPVQTAGN